MFFPKIKRNSEIIVKSLVFILFFTFIFSVLPFKFDSQSLVGEVYAQGNETRPPPGAENDPTKPGGIDITDESLAEAKKDTNILGFIDNIGDGVLATIIQYLGALLITFFSVILWIA